MIVDALVLAGPDGDAARNALDDTSPLPVPELTPAEVVAGLRRLVLAGDVEEMRARRALNRLRRLRINPFPFEPFMDRVWELRHTLTVYDAWYVALAEELGTDLVTADGRLVRAAGPRCRVVHVRDVAGGKD